jgi:hypothetical protein
MSDILAKVNIGTQRHRVVGCIAWLDEWHDSNLRVMERLPSPLLSLDVALPPAWQR